MRQSDYEYEERSFGDIQTCTIVPALKQKR